MNNTLTTVVLAAMLGIGFGAGWTIQQHHIDKLKLEQAHERISQQRAARASVERALSQATAAQNAGVARAIHLRQSANDARSALDGLRVATDAALRSAAESADASLAAAATASRLLNQCAAEYQTLGERCDRHVNDIKTLTESWPK